MTVSIVIVSYKVPYHLMLCLDSLQNALMSISSEIIVIDNASGDDTAQLVSQFYPEVKYIQNSNNDGFSKANNKAIDLAKGEYICLINPDTIVSECLIANTIKKHRTLKKPGILGVRLIDGTGNFLSESKINALTLKVAALKLLGYAKPFYNTAIKENEEGETATLVGAFMCFRKQDYKILEGLDERYFMYGEDIDLSYQFTKAGFKNYYLGSEKMIHFKGESTVRDKLYFKRFFDSVKLFFTKHYSNSTLINSIMSIFFVIAKYFKKSDMEKRERSTVEFNSIFLVSEDLALKSELENQFNQDVKLMTSGSLNSITTLNDLVIFDTGKLKYETIIDFMVNNCKQNNVYRFTVPHCNAVLGSDSSTSQAKVIFLD